MEKKPKVEVSNFIRVELGKFVLSEERKNHFSIEHLEEGELYDDISLTELRNLHAIIGVLLENRP